MTWVKLDDEFWEHAKIVPLSDKAFRLHVSALCLCGRLLTDGNVRPNHLRQLAAVLSIRNIHRVVDELIAARLWHTKSDGSHHINDYLAYNPSSVKVKENRIKNAEKQKSYRLRKGSRYQSVTASRTPTPITNEEPTTLVLRDVTSEVDAENVIDLKSVLKDVS